MIFKDVKKLVVKKENVSKISRWVNATNAIEQARITSASASEKCL